MHVKGFRESKLAFDEKAPIEPDPMIVEVIAETSEFPVYFEDTIRPGGIMITNENGDVLCVIRDGEVIAANFSENPMVASPDELKPDLRLA